MTERVDTRPLRTAAQQQTGVVVAGALGSGAGGGLGLAYLASLSTFGIGVGRVDLLIAFALSAIGAATPSVLAQLRALSRVVRDGERDTTPWRDAHDDNGQPLRAHDDQVLELALDELRTRRDGDAAGRAAQRRPGTRAFPAVGSARSMRAADGPPSKQVRDEDWVGDEARTYDEGWRDRSSDPSVRRGRDVADRSDRRRHQLDDRATRR